MLEDHESYSSPKASGEKFMFDLKWFATTSLECPIFLFASGHRCGSTLLQRLLNSCPDILIWGEQRGYLNRFVQEFQTLLEWETQSSQTRKTFLLKGYNNFLANMMPEDHELKWAAATYIAALFGMPAMRLDRPIWGFKEVRYDAQLALFLQECFPKARFIHLTRNIVDCFISLKRWEDSPTEDWTREWTGYSIWNWGRINNSFLEVGDSISNLISIRFEDMVADPEKFIEKLAKFLEMDAASFDHSVFETRIHGAGSAGRKKRSKKILPSDLNAEERALILQGDMIKVASAYGYKIEF